MLDFLSRSVATVELSLDRQAYQPGDAIHARVSVHSEKEVKVRQGRISLLYNEKYQVRSRTTTGGRQPRQSYSYSWRTDAREVITEDFLAETVIGPNFSQVYEFNWTMPAGVIPGLKANIFEVTWLVKAMLEREMAVDINTESNILVSVPMPAEVTAQADGLLHEFTNNQLEKVALSLILPRTAWQAGETIAGKLLMQARDDIKLTDIRMELVRSEKVPENAGNETEERLSWRLAESTSLAAGQTLSLPFQIEIPTDAAPSVTLHHGDIWWKIDGILARRLAQDYHIEQPLEIFGKAA